jgi:hypothetical protein
MIRHRTKVAGIIAGVGYNEVGVRGVAHAATLRGYNLLAIQDEAGRGVSSAELAGAFGGAEYSDDNDIFNASLSFNFSVANQAILPSVSSLRESILVNASSNLRAGKGALLVQSAGNSFGSLSRGNCTRAINLQVSCGNVSSDPMRATADVIVVGAVNAEGKKSSYSTTGAGIWVAAPGGEFGYNARYVTSSSIAYKPAITTTARTGCQNYPFGGSVNDLDKKDGSNSLATQCQYTATMNGTSSAAPNVSGVIALMLEVNPGLSYRDIKHILASTSQRNDSAFSGISTAAVAPIGETLVIEQPWIQNSAGYWFSHRYGFGLIDASAAVEMAKTFAGLPAREDSIVVEHATSAERVIASGASHTMTFDLSSTIQNIENVRLEVNMSTSSVMCTQIEVTSPSGTKSIVLGAGTGFSNSRLTNVRLLSNAFYGEPSGGRWSMVARHTCFNGRTVFATNDVQTLYVTGH